MSAFAHLSVLDGNTIRARVSMPQLIEALKLAFAMPGVVPLRHIEPVPGGSGDRLLVSMPAFGNDGSGIVKLATVMPDNAVRRLPTIQALIIAFSASGTPIALMDGTIVTRLRTGAASALAASYLSRTDSSELCLLGTGALAPYMALGHCCVRPIRRIHVWGRRQAAMEDAVLRIRAQVGDAIDVLPVRALERAVFASDIICCATSSSTPVLQGAWLKSGAFVDLVGSFSPDSREADDDVVRRARIFVDTYAGALAEAGDLLDPLARGVISRNRIEGELTDLACGRMAGRENDVDITLFKSVGTALEDLAAAQLIACSAWAHHS